MPIDAERDYTPDDVLTCDDALSLAVLGYKVRAEDMAEGTFVDYNFNGWRIHHAAGASSGWSQRTHDYSVNWHVLPDEHYDAYKRVIAERDAEPPKKEWGGDVHERQKWGGAGVHLQQFGRALRAVPPAPVVAKDWALDATKEVLAVPTPTAAPSVGKWGKPAPVVPTKDKWGRSS